jgi:ATP-dependent Clp protease protease subunit
MASHTGQPVKQIEKDTDRDFIMTAPEAKEYGIIDQVILKLSDAKDKAPALTSV